VADTIPRTISVLCVCAHPDDECLGPGGVLARWVSEGATVSVGVLTDGVLARPGATAADVERRQDQFLESCFILGVNPLIDSDPFPDQRLDTVPLLDVTQRIEGWLAATEAVVVLAHTLADLNRDHQIAHQATLTAARSCPVVYTYPVMSSTQWRAFQPTLFVRTSDEARDRKARALSCYREEIAANPSRNKEHVQIQSMRWFDLCGLWDAEAFEVIREVRS
jgi:N-acetylglucosamine malate deacetylase 1